MTLLPEYFQQLGYIGVAHSVSGTSGSPLNRRRRWSPAEHKLRNRIAKCRLRWMFASTRNKGKLQPNSPPGMMSFIGSGCQESGEAQ